MTTGKLLLLIGLSIFTTCLFGQTATIKINDYYCLKIDNKYGTACELKHKVTNPIKLEAGEHTFELYYPTKGETVLQVVAKMAEGKSYSIDRIKDKTVVKENNEIINTPITSVGLNYNEIENIKTLTPWGKKQTVQKAILSADKDESELAYIHYYKDAKITENVPLFVLYKINDLWGKNGRYNYLAEGGFIVGIEPGKHNLEGIIYKSSVGDCQAREIEGSINCEAGKKYIIGLKKNGYNYSITIEESPNANN